jgi:membrane-associated phospholipid phosphatase
VIDGASAQYIYLTLCEDINPVLVGVWMGQVLADYRDQKPFWRTFCIASIFGVVVTQAANHFFRDSNILPGHNGFPSGHETFAVSIITSMTIRDRRWLWLLTPVAIILATALVIRHAHDPVDVVGAVILTPPFTYLCHMATKDSTMSLA